MDNLPLDEHTLARRLAARPVTTIVVVSILAVVVSATLLIDRWAQSSLSDWRSGWEGPDYEVLLQPGMDSAAVATVRGRIETSGPIIHTLVVGATEARDELERILGSGIFDALTDNPLSTAVRVDVAATVRSDSLVARLAEETLFFPGVVDVIYDPERLRAYRDGEIWRIRLSEQTRPYGLAACLVLFVAFLLALLRTPKMKFQALIWWGHSDRRFVRGAMREGAIWAALAVAAGFAVSELAARRVIPIVPAQSAVGPPWEMIAALVALAMVLGAICGYIATQGYRRVH